MKGRRRFCYRLSTFAGDLYRTADSSPTWLLSKDPSDDVFEWLLFSASQVLPEQDLNPGTTDPPLTKSGAE